MMPDLNGIQICRMLRADPKLKRIPIIFLTAKAEQADRIAGLETGADDYVAKPFQHKRTRPADASILRRVSEGPPTAERRLQVGQIVLDVDCHEVSINGVRSSSPPPEFKLLHLLMERRGRVQTREHLLINVWNYETEIETRTVDTHVRRLRESSAPKPTGSRPFAASATAWPSANPRHALSSHAGTRRGLALALLRLRGRRRIARSLEQAILQKQLNLHENCRAMMISAVSPARPTS